MSARSTPRGSDEAEMLFGCLVSLGTRNEGLRGGRRFVEQPQMLRIGNWLSL